jgi:acyl transferase domain-containing protein
MEYLLKMGAVEQSSDIGNSGDEPIAIIGLDFEFPQGATSDPASWQMILDGRSASTEFSPDRMNIDAFYHPDLNRSSSVRCPDTR